MKTLKLESADIKTAIDAELKRIGVDMEWDTKSENGRFAIAYSNSDAPWFTLPRKKWASALLKLREIKNPDDVYRAFIGASAGPEWDGR
jgi:hypothetical protein